MKNFAVFSTIVSFLLLTPLSSGQNALPAGVTKVASVEGISQYQFDNGLRLLVFPDPSKSTITVNITYLVGSRYEGSGEGGMAHLLEHMVFKPSKNHANIPQELNEHGARFNGSTTEDRTNYFETFPATDANLRWALALESDRMVNAFIKQEDFDKEFSVVRNEFERSENSPFNVLFEHTKAAAYLAHSYGRPVIGNKSDVERVPITNLQTFYRKFYQPDNAILTIAGKVDEAQIVSLVAEDFGKIPRPARVLEPTHTVEPPQDGERLTTVRRVGDIQAVITAYHVPDGASPDSAALDVLSAILGEPSSGRLYKALVDNKQATEVFADSEQHNEPGLFIAGAVLRSSDNLDTARKTLLNVISAVASEPPSKEEVDRAKTRLLKNIDLTLNDSDRVGLFMSEWIAMGDWRMLFLDRDRIKNVTPADVKRVAAAYLKESNRTIGEFIPDAKPDRAEIPAKTDIAAAVKDYKSDAAISQGEAFEPTPGNIEARTTRFTLPSGMKVAFLPKKTRGGTVHAVISLHFGTVETLKNKDIIGSLTAAALIRGTTAKNRQQIQDEIDKLKAQINVGGSATGANVSIETVRANLIPVLQLAGEILEKATIPDSEFEQIRKEELTGVEFSKSEPQALAPLELNRALRPFPLGDVRRSVSFDEQMQDLNKAKVEEARAFYKQFYGANHAEVGIVGDFDPAEAKKAITELFGSFNNSAPYERVKLGFEKTPVINRTIETPDKQNAVFVAGERLPLADTDPNYAGALFGNYMLGGGAMNSRLATRIRVKDGLSYGVGSRLTASAHEADGEFTVFAIAAPQNITKVEAAFKEELAKALRDGFPASEVDAERSGWLQSRQVNRGDDRVLAGALAANEENGRTFAFSEKLENTVRQMTPEQVSAAMRAVVDPNAISIVKAGDFKKAAAAAAAPGGAK